MIWKTNHISVKDLIINIFKLLSFGNKQFVAKI